MEGQCSFMYTEFMKVRNWHSTPIVKHPISPKTDARYLRLDRAQMLTDAQVQHGGWGLQSQQHKFPELSLGAATRCQPQLMCGEPQPFGQRHLLCMFIPSYHFLRVEQACKCVALMCSYLNKVIPSWVLAGRRERNLSFSDQNIQCPRELRFIEWSLHERTFCMH